jgi:uncharacterized protein YndB with AHSA1/START domain
MSYSYEVSRVIDAPAETVWAAWTDEKHNEGVFHAVPGSAKIDLRPGGAWSNTMKVPDGTEVPMSGTYGEIVPNERLVTFMDTPPGVESSPMTMDLVATDGGTKVTLAQTCATKEERDMAEEGSTMLLEWCADYVATIS